MNNRIIKFRVWSIQLNKFLSKEEYCLDFDGKLILVELEYDSLVRLKAVNPKYYVLQQFTGLLDKNGKEIYEGDIIKYIDKRSEYQILKIEYNNFYNRFQISGFDFTYFNNKYSEIIGNIFETPELLK